MSKNILGARLIDLPGDLAAVSRADTASEVPAVDGALSPRAVTAIWAAVENLYRTRAYPAVTFCLRRRGEVVLNRSIGHASGNGPADNADAPKVLAQPDTPICLFSASKAITAILMHKLAEEGGVDLNAPVADYIPEFAQKGKDKTTIAQVLSHRGGFPSFAVPQADKRPETLLDQQRCVELICAASPTHKRNPPQAYHALTGGILLGEVIRRVTGAPLTNYLDSRLRQPLGMRYFTFGLAPEERARVGVNYMAGQPLRYPLSKIAERVLTVPFEAVVEASNADVFMDAVVPSGNLYASAEEVSRFYQMLLDGGEYKGQQVLQPETVARAIRPVSGPKLDRSLKLPMRYSEGLMLGLNPYGLYGPMCARAYGHLGFMNILGWADPDRDIAASMLVTGKALMGGHLLAFEKLLTTIVWQCRGH